MARKRNKKGNETVANNGLSDALGIPTQSFGNPALNSPAILANNINPFLITLNWWLLANAYKSIGYIQMLIDEPVDDAFKNDALKIDTKTLDEEELKALQKVFKKDLKAIKNVLRWGRLYGGGVLVANTEQDPNLPLNKSALFGKKLEFLACDRWNCPTQGSNLATTKFFTVCNPIEGVNGVTVHRTRTKVFTGKEPTSFHKAMLGGWGMSVYESVLSALNQFLKANNVILELLDEAKIDILKIHNLANTLLSPNGEAVIKKRLQIAADNKNYKSMLGIDDKDSYEQKQISFGSIDKIMEQIQFLICSITRFPYSKVFGKGSAGFSSGEDELENYNSMVERDVREPSEEIIEWALSLRCWQLFGREVPDLVIDWEKLQSLTAVEQQNVTTSKIDNLLKLVNNGIITRQAMARKLSEENIMLFSDKEINEIDNDFMPYSPENAEYEPTRETNIASNSKATMGKRFSRFIQNLRGKTSR